jgi:hypothetical protein
VLVDGLNDLLHIPLHTIGVVVAAPIDDDTMWNALHVEREGPEITEQKGRVVENVEILRSERVR